MYMTMPKVKYFYQNASVYCGVHLYEAYNTYSHRKEKTPNASLA